MLRYDADTMKIVGFTITAFRQYFLPRYPEFCFLLDMVEKPRHAQKAGAIPRQEAYQAAALSRTTSSLITQYASA